MKRSERELQEEVAFHQEMARRLHWLEDLGRDVRLALRRLRHARGFAATAVLTLALGIGANTALFTLVHAVLLARLPVPHAEQLALLGNPGFTGVESGVSDHEVDGLTYTQYQQLRAQSRAFSGLAAFTAFEPSFRLDWGSFTDEAVPAKLVSDNYFAVLGLNPARGHFFDSATAPEAVMSYGYWQQHFGGDPAVVGRTFHLRAATFTIAGIAPRGFTGTTVGQSPALYLPLELQPQILVGRDWRPDPPGMRRVVWLLGIGRLKPGVSVAEAEASSAVIFAESVRAQAAQADASDQSDILTQRLRVTAAASGASSLRDSFTRPLLSLQVLVGLVLLIVIVNLGGMLLSQASARQREFALRLSLGASRGRLVRQLLTEALVLALAGGAAGWFLAQWGERILVRWVAAGDPTLALPYQFDPMVLGFTAGVCVLAGVAFGLAPALRLAGGNLAQRSGRHRGAALPGGLVVAQVAVALVLVTGAALFVRSLEQLRSVALGYGTEGLVTFNLNAAMAGASEARSLEIYQRVADAMRHVPGVSAVTYSENGLFTGLNSGDGMVIPGYTKNDAGAGLDEVAPGYFSALGIPLLLGREFTPADRSRGVKPIVIDATLAKKYFAGRSPLGTVITVQFSDGAMRFEVVGVAAPSKEQSPRDSASEARAYFDIENGHEPGGLRSVNFELRTRAGAGLSRDGLNRLVAGASGLPLRVNSFSSVQALLDTTIAPDLLLAKLAGFFALLALGLAAMGLYAMLSYGVARRRAEIGIRMALGARARQVTGGVLGEALRLLAAGTGLGIVASLALGRSLASLLFDLKPNDPASLAAAALGLAVCGLAAALVPALRAARTDPAQTLRAE